ncbi:hypothetical protein A3J15_00510 [Candidatus Roizmanbacteria bacterium RIFCSPLOWO2_02_FULL_38_10]|uniref:Dephospho-CoA kinase n=1 Tax=Candidatus Roizmanbacteria bacterium RIFCSPLOWO2_02_FULL_38_10 TaxID=1802074 RepID=A0A1F7JKB0_9BACT|nr:MAG: hypothetical protein A3J15_00510 [Candidatus Roizmanbacteria bacterium RIFCSPLOWO2_02_FULL_38_10]
MESKQLLCLVGMPGAGKSEAAKFFSKRGVPVVIFGDIINDHVDKFKLPHTVAVHKKLRQKLRTKYGMQALAKLNETTIRELFKRHELIVIDGLRSWEEYTYLRGILTGVNILIIAIWAPKKIRYLRIKKRARRSKLGGEERDLSEMIETNMGPTISFADDIILNHGSILDLNRNLDLLFNRLKLN